MERKILLIPLIVGLSIFGIAFTLWCVYHFQHDEQGWGVLTGLIAAVVWWTLYWVLGVFQRGE